ncbi:magnesium transporter [Staphylococcus cornubiensis]|uniref:magnesium transporter n=1 Tax=Staphylococcus cornubiensis TaxID=1986155 RepID=UPI000A36F6A9|nr:magnesium transporter [Staphylococcus cornubiensis]
MRKDVFEYKIKKELWYLNRREKNDLTQYFEKHSIETLQQQYRTPRSFVNHYLQHEIFGTRIVSSGHLVTSLVGLLIANILLLGLFITGLLLSLSAINYFIQPQVSLSIGVVIAILLSAIVLMIVAVYLMKRANAFFTKRLLLYKFNKVN